jgi:hypothetical protein
MDATDERWATLVVRLWTEPSAPEGFRGRLIAQDVRSGAKESTVVDTEVGMVSQIRAWLRAFLAS